MENPPFEDVFPIQDGDFPLLCLFTGGYHIASKKFCFRSSKVEKIRSHARARDLPGKLASLDAFRVEHWYLEDHPSEWSTMMCKSPKACASKWTPYMAFLWLIKCL